MYSANFLENPGLDLFSIQPVLIDSFPGALLCFMERFLCLNYVFRKLITKLGFYICSVVEHQDDVKFELQGDRIPHYLKGSINGNLFLTNSMV